MNVRISGGRGRYFCQGMFGLWGLLVGAVAIFAALSAPALTAIVACLIWIGGMLFFGMLGLLSESTIESVDKAK